MAMLRSSTLTAILDSSLRCNVYLPHALIRTAVRLRVRSVNAGPLA